MFGLRVFGPHSLKADADMASWIESHTVLMRHRKLIELSRALGIRRSYALGHLHALWHTAIEQQEDGDLSAWSDDMIAEVSDYQGDAHHWVKALQTYGFLTGRLIHDWPDYAGRYLESKYRTSKPERWAKIKGKWAKTDYRQTKDGPHNSTVQDKTLHNLPNPPLAQSAAPSALPLAGGVEVIKFPLPGEGKDQPIGDGEFSLWRQAYPGVDIMTELAKMRAWLLERPRQRKTRRGMGKFIVGWLDRAQNARGGKQEKGAAAVVPGKYDGIGEKV